MIILHCTDNDAFAAEVEQKLKDLVVAHKVRKYSDSDPALPELPFLRENGTLVIGKEVIRKYLDELARELDQQRSVTGDACYIDPDTGDVC
jgi:hypothetical protein